jgi:glycosyltransferase involved in cell wall biosynthesis
MIAEKRKKVAILSLDPVNGGGILHSLLGLHRFCQERFETTVFFPDFSKQLSASFSSLKFSSQVKKEKVLGMDCVRVGTKFAFWEPGHYAFVRDQWAKLLQPYDFFFVSSGTPIAAHPLVLLDKKFILWVATPFSEDRAERLKTLPWWQRVLSWLTTSSMQKIEQKVLQQAAAILPMSHYAQDRFVQIVGQKKKMSVVGFPLSSHCFSQKRLDLSKTVVAIGRFTDPRKNLKMLLEVWENLSPKSPNAQLFVIGSVPESVANDSKLSKQGIKFFGTVSGPEKVRIVKEANFALITSQQEGLGIVGLEAMAQGLPVISTDCGGVSDYVKEGKTGFFVPQGDAVAMAKRCQYLLQNPHLCWQMGQAAQAFVQERFSQEAVHADFEKAVEQAYGYRFDASLSCTADHDEKSAGRVELG